MSKSVGTGPSSYGKRIYRAAVSQRLRNSAVDKDHKARINPERLRCNMQTLKQDMKTQKKKLVPQQTR